MKREFKVGDKVFDSRFGEGVVLCAKSYSLYVEFCSVITDYTNEGKYLYSDSRPSLLHLHELPQNSQERVVLVSDDGVEI